MSSCLVLTSLFAYPVIVGVMALVAWFVLDETWYLDERK